MGDTARIPLELSSPPATPRSPPPPLIPSPRLPGTLCLPAPQVTMSMTRMLSMLVVATLTREMELPILPQDSMPISLQQATLGCQYTTMGRTGHQACAVPHESLEYEF